MVQKFPKAYIEENECTFPLALKDESMLSQAGINPALLNKVSAFKSHPVTDKSLNWCFPAFPYKVLQVNRKHYCHPLNTVKYCTL